ncbi:hypothetical protein L3X38_038204 [Prunus dulcis]|uniref:Uncharacterized protein n=1 Tax=Prunus dulcis TaxID=3755 RepID=A0AAD4V727_PRUDU|nr:hypothetical protein L3X38_038204 [Prunus dulcis]
MLASAVLSHASGQPSGQFRLRASPVLVVPTLPGLDFCCWNRFLPQTPPSPSPKSFAGLALRGRLQKSKFIDNIFIKSMSRAAFFVQMLVLVVLAATVSAQESAPAPAPAQMDAGAGYSLPVNGAAVGASLMVSVFALFKHYLN